MMLLQEGELIPVSALEFYSPVNHMKETATP